MLTISPGRALAIVCLSIGTAAGAAPTIDRFPIPGGRIPLLLTEGPDGAVWGGTTKGFVIRVADDGGITEFPLPDPEMGVAAITTGPDGNLWFPGMTSKTTRSIERMTPEGQVTTFPISAGTGLLLGIATGSDGNLWFTDDQSAHGNFSGEIGRITTSGEITEQPVPAAAGAPILMAAGPDGAVWFTAHSANGNSIVRVTTDFKYIVFPLSLGSLDALGIAAGGDGNLWFSAVDPKTGAGTIGRMTPQGSTTLIPIPVASPFPEAISPGPCLDLWFAAAEGIGRVTFAGKVTMFAVPGFVDSELTGVAANANRDVWFSDQSAASMARIALLGCRALAKVSKETPARPARVRER